MKNIVAIAVLALICGTAVADETYVVSGGDSLWKIAKAQYGDGEKWPIIYQANRRKLKNPNHIRPGWKLVIPSQSRSKRKQEYIPHGYEYWKTVNTFLTAYEPSRTSCGKYADGRTSTGRNAWRMNGCAADPRVIPYWTMAKIPGVGWKLVDDTGGAMRQSARRGIYHIDVRFTYVYQANRYGEKWKSVKLYRKVRKSRNLGRVASAQKNL